LIQNCHPIAIDGTQKLVRDGQCWAEEWLDRSGATWSQQYVYILEANLVFHNGMTLPLFTEFLSHAEGDTDTTKQEFPELPLMILLDGLYASGPIFELCSEYLHWAGTTHKKVDIYLPPLAQKATEFFAAKA